VEDFLDRAHYKRGKRKHQGWRNGYEEGKVTTAEGLLEIALPRVRETEEPFHSRLSPVFKKGSDMLGRLVREMYVRGLSTRDVEEMFTEALGQRVLSRSGVSRITSRLQKDFDN